MVKINFLQVLICDAFSSGFDWYMSFLLFAPSSPEKYCRRCEVYYHCYACVLKCLLFVSIYFDSGCSLRVSIFNLTISENLKTIPNFSRTEAEAVWNLYAVLKDFLASWLLHNLEVHTSESIAQGVTSTKTRCYFLTKNLHNY